MQPLVSVCMPTLNAHPFLEERMETIMSQTVTDWELIVCDSYSDDGTWEFLQKFKLDKRVRLHQVPREGLYAGWNECLRRATGEYVYIATADDTMQPGLLEAMIKPLMKFKEIDIAVCDYQEINESGREQVSQQRETVRQLYGATYDIPCIRNGKTEFLAHACFITVWMIMNSVLFRRSLLHKTGYFRTDMLSFADADWTLRASLASDIAFIPHPLAQWRRRFGQATPPQRTAEWAWIDFHSLQSVIDDPRTEIPSSWRIVPEWRQMILSVRLARYLKHTGLYRWVAREKPAKFLKAVNQTLQLDVDLLGKRLLHGFGADDLMTFDGEDRASVFHRLVTAFGTSWPPKECESVE